MWYGSGDGKVSEEVERVFGSRPRDRRRLWFARFEEEVLGDSGCVPKEDLRAGVRGDEISWRAKSWIGQDEWQVEDRQYSRKIERERERMKERRRHVRQVSDGDLAREAVAVGADDFVELGAGHAAPRRFAAGRRGRGPLGALRRLQAG